jgi:hypothetical protein
VIQCDFSTTYYNFRGILLSHEKDEIAEKDSEFAENFQNEEVARFVDLKKNELDGERLAEELYEREQAEFRRAEEDAIRRNKIAERDLKKAAQLQKDELQSFKGKTSVKRRKNNKGSINVSFKTVK